MKFVRFSVKYAYFLRIVPFSWNDFENKIEIPKPNKSILNWNFIKWFYMVHQIFLLFRVAQSGLTKDKTIMGYAVEIGYFAEYLVVCVLQASLILNGTDWVNFFNYYIKFYEKLAGITSSALYL